MPQTDGFAAASPQEPEFRTAYDVGDAQVVWRKCVNDTDTPVSAYLKIAGAQRNAFLLESVEGGESLGRYSIIGLKPDTIWRAKDGVAEINRTALSDASTFVRDEMPMLESLRAFLAESRIALPDTHAADLPPMFAGVFGFFGYEIAHQLENLPATAASGLDLPDAIFIRPTVLAVFDNVSREITFITPVHPSPEIDAATAYQQAAGRIDHAMASLRDERILHPPKNASAASPQFESGIGESEYMAMVEAAQEYIRAGDIFQVVLSQRFSCPFNADPFELYRALRRLNPSPFLFYLNFDACTLVGSSPEILVRVRNGEVTIRPIAGTRPRGRDPAHDRALEQELLADPKEAAEHLMLLDLGRNDVARSAKPGSVTVTEQFTIERYSHVMHIVSNVTGKLADGADAVDALMAGFPAGTVSGAPKIRAMEIIAELEKNRRGPYAGCIGYFSADGDLDTCIALRTAVIKDGQMYVQAGAGIVADSNPYDENLECRNKAGALFQAAEMVLSGNTSS